MTQTIAIHTLGCKANQYDSAGLLASLPIEIREVPFKSTADIYIINTCTVTGKTDSHSRQAIRRALSLNPNALIIVTGCYAEINSGEISGISGVDYIVGNFRRHLIPELIEKGKPASPPQIFVDRDEILPLPAKPPRFSRRTRVFFKIQEGCDAFCAYCIVPYTRGLPRSLPPRDVMTGLDFCASNDIAEVVLTAINLSIYGVDLDPPQSLSYLLNIINEANPVPRLRLSSLEPDRITPKLIEQILSSSSICPHLHLSLQAGDDILLERMGRKYATFDVEQIVGELKSRNPDICLGVDLIAGLPGEDEASFKHGLDFLESLSVDYFHVFPYSRRPGTPAAKMDSQIENTVKAERSRILRELGQKKRLSFYNRFLNRELPVLMQKAKDGVATGLSRNYIPVRLKDRGFVQGEEIPVRISRIENMKVWGEPTG